MADINEISYVRIGLASPSDIRRWSHGEVKRPETINYRQLKPEPDGLFCQKIFGPVKDYECRCGRYKKPRFKGMVCEHCSVEITTSKVRRERMGHIELAAPVAHIWFFKGVPSRIAYMLDLSSKDVERVVYFASHIVLRVDDEKRGQDIHYLKSELEKDIEELDRLLNEETGKIQEDVNTRMEELEKRLQAVEDRKEASKIRNEKKKLERELKRRTLDLAKRIDKEKQHLKKVYETFEKVKPKQLVSDDEVYRDMVDRYGDYFTGGIGATALKELLSEMDLEEEVKQLKETIKISRGQKKTRAIKRLKIVNSFLKSGNLPGWMIFEVIPVLPPDLRPMVQLDGGRFASSDLNDLYRRVINRNERLKRLLDLEAPEIIVNNEKRMLQEAVDSLFDNSRRTRPVTGTNNRPLKSLSDMLKGKQGRFRQNLLGKRVDYSGRSVIVVGPEVKMHQCGLPKLIALELFKPFVMRRLVELNHAPNIKSAKRMIERQHSVVWDVLEEVIRDNAVLLNRAPTLHRLGIQAFEPKLIEGKAIQIHPLVCPPFNADFDGDQMAVHLPLSVKAQAEARILMLSSNNILSPANGRPIVSPTQDMILGIYWLTADPAENIEEKGDSKYFASVEEAMYAFETGEISVRARIKVRMNERGINGLYETSIGRIIFNRALPEDWPFMNNEIVKNELSSLIEQFTRKYSNAKVAEILDNLKELGFKYATKPGITIAMDEMSIPENKWDIINGAEGKASEIEKMYQDGLITEEERHQKVIELWTKATEDVKEAMTGQFDKFNPLYVMAYSGARGSLTQIYQLAGMRGLVANPKGEIIDHPITSNFREGLSVLEYFSSTHGARKGLADTALRTADSGYLTRRLVDVCQDVIVREEDCGTTAGRPIKIFDQEGKPRKGIIGRLALRDVVDPKTREVLVEANQIINEEVAERIYDFGMEEIQVRSPLACRSRHGVCQSCYGWSLADRRPVENGEAVGIIAAQSIGEPGTQLTMRTFHTGGIAGEDITHGLPRVVELFEARKPKGQAILADVSGILRVIENDRERKLVIVGDDGKEYEHVISRRARVRFNDGEEVKAGEQLTEGALNPHDLLRVKGILDVELYLVEQVQEVYKSQGVEIDDKHIEIVVRQMLRRVSIQSSGDTDFLPGQLVDKLDLEAVNTEMKKEGKKPATSKPVLMGITKGALATESFLSAASFQETTRVLTEAAIAGKTDQLLGLKENVIIGKLIPAGTGMPIHYSYGPELIKKLEEVSKIGEVMELTSDLLSAEKPDEGAFAEEEAKSIFDQIIGEEKAEEE